MNFIEDRIDNRIENRNFVDTKWVPSALPMRSATQPVDSRLPLTRENIAVLSLQAIVVVAILIVARPSFVLTSRGELSVALLHLPTVLVIAIGSVGCTIMVNRVFSAPRAQAII